MEDPIVEEIHRNREELARKFNGDMAAMLADARARQADSKGHPIRTVEESLKLAQASQRLKR